MSICWWLGRQKRSGFQWDEGAGHGASGRGVRSWVMTGGFLELEQAWGFTRQGFGGHGHGGGHGTDERSLRHLHVQVGGANVVLGCMVGPDFDLSSKA